MTKPLVYNNQTAFMAMRNHVLSMTERCWSSKDASCLYNGETKSGKDNHCAVGILLEGIDLSEKENTGNIHFIIRHNQEVGKRIGSCNSSLLRECQGLHDATNNWGLSDSVEKRRREFSYIAKAYNLQVE